MTFQQDPRIHSEPGECVCGSPICARCNPMPTNSPTSTEQVNTPHEDGSLTLCNAAVQRLLDYGVLHYTDEGYYVGKWPGTNKPSRNTPADSEVERVARAIVAKTQEQLSRKFGSAADLGGFDGYTAEGKQEALEVARAAIAALPPKPVDGGDCPVTEADLERWAPLPAGMEPTVSKKEIVSAVDGEVAELVERLRDAARAYAGMLHAQHAFDCRRAADMLLALSRKTEPMATDVTPAMIHEGAAAYYDCVPVSTLSPECVADTISAIYLAMLSAGKKGTDYA